MKTDKFESEWGPDGSQVDYYRRAYGRDEPIMAAIATVYDRGSQVAKDFAEDSEVFPVTSFLDMNKAEMVEHMVEVHGFRECAGKAMSIAAGTKATKEELIAAHTRAHNALENPMSEFGVHGHAHSALRQARYGNLDEVKFAIGGVMIPSLNHAHQSPALSTAGAAVRDNKPAGDKPLSAAEATVLKELVNNDFAGLKAEMSAFAADALAQSIAEANAEWDEKEKALPDFAKDATKARRKRDEKKAAAERKYQEALDAIEAEFRDAFEATKEKAAEQGVTLKEDREEYADDQGNKKHRPVYVASVEGRQQAIDAISAENKKFLDRALMTLEGQRLAAQRRVLVSRVNPQGAAILDTIPDAKALMSQAYIASNAVAQISTGPTEV